MTAYQAWAMHVVRLCITSYHIRFPWDALSRFRFQGDHDFDYGAC